MTVETVVILEKVVTVITVVIVRNSSDCHHLPHLVEAAEVPLEVPPDVPLVVLGPVQLDGGDESHLGPAHSRNLPSPQVLQNRLSPLQIHSLSDIQ